MGRSGVSVIISGILMVIFVVALASVLGPWAEDLTEGLTGTSDENVDEVIEGQNADLTVKDHSLDKFDGDINITLQNTGEVELEDLTVDIVCSDGGIVRENMGGSLETGEVTVESLTSNDMVGCTANTLRIFPENVQDTEEEIEDINQKKYLVMGLSDDSSEFSSGKAGYFFIPTDADFESIDGNLSSYDDLAKISPGGFTEHPEWSSYGIVHLGGGRFVSTDNDANGYYWDIGDLRDEDLDGNNFRVSDSFEELNFIDGDYRYMARVSDTEFGILNGSTNEAEIFDVGSEVGASNNLVDTFPAYYNALGGLSNVGGRKLLSHDDQASGEGISRIYRAGDNNDGTNLSKDDTKMVTGVRTDNYLVVSRMDEGGGPSNISVYDASNGLEDIFDSDPVNVYNGTESTNFMAAQMTHLRGNYVAIGYAELGGDSSGEVHVIDFTEAESREDAENLYTSIKINGLASPSPDFLVINTGFDTYGGVIYILDPFDARTVDDADLVIEDNLGDFRLPAPFAVEEF